MIDIKITLIAFLISLVIILPMAMAHGIPFERSCINATHILYSADPNISGTVITVSDPQLCPNGCDTDRRRCTEPYNMDTAQFSMGSTLFLLLFIISAALFIYGILRERIIPTMISTILFLVLAFQSFALDTMLRGTQFSSLTWVFILLCWVIAIASLAATLIGLVSIIREKVDKEEKNE